MSPPCIESKLASRSGEKYRHFSCLWPVLTLLSATYRHYKHLLRRDVLCLYSAAGYIRKKLLMLRGGNIIARIFVALLQAQYNV